MSRTGVVAQKLGMTRLFNDNGEHVPVTVLQLNECEVISTKTVDKDGYNAVQLGAGVVKAKNVSKPMKGHFAKNKVEPKAKLVEFRVNEDALLEPGSKLSADHFVIGQLIDVTGISIGKGFAGGMKRHGFGGLRATHGVSKAHRSHGSTGQCQDPGRTFKNKKMAGHMGSEKVTIQNLEVIDVDVEKGLIIVKGSVPGRKQGYVLLKDAVKTAAPDNLPYPASLFSDKKVTPANEVSEEQVEENAQVEQQAEDQVQKNEQQASGEAEDK